MFFIMLVGISLLGEVNRVVTWLITGGVVVLRLLVSGLRIQRRIGVSRSAYNESYPEPDGRSGTHVPISTCFMLPHTLYQTFVTYIINNIRTRFIISFYVICAVIYCSFYCIYV